MLKNRVSLAQSTFTYTFDSVIKNVPYYKLGFINSGYTVMFNFSTNGGIAKLTSAVFLLESD